MVSKVKVFQLPTSSRLPSVAASEVVTYKPFYIQSANLVQTRFGERIVFRCSFHPDHEPTFAFFLAPTQDRLNTLQLMLEVWKDHPEAVFGPVRLRKLGRGYILEKFDAESILD